MSSIAVVPLPRGGRQMRMGTCALYRSSARGTFTVDHASQLWTIDPRVGFLLNLPVVGSIIEPHLGGTGTYRVLLQPNPATCGGILERYQAVSLNGLR